eukprot:CAMPEP_0196731114 /NCGR_PEP_ID=MMETSP1091-20130531/10972_1 /TAXON_ID=302021 /ORGANISM="Rhodomonas sp., Strain CCMP768" /LENGTH=176 /DNA_ID=CAMNT_0042074225 /DNA_START=84 /DNA_END=616 /DNA_ORIENTATION=-
MTPAWAAACYGDTKLLSFLADNGADLTRPNHLYDPETASSRLNSNSTSFSRSQGWPPIFAAAANGQAECVALLVERQVPLDSRATGGCYKGQTALEAARREGHTHVVEILANLKSTRKKTAACARETEGVELEASIAGGAVAGGAPTASHESRYMMRCHSPRHGQTRRGLSSSTAK